jgi:hypothetical protein
MLGLLIAVDMNREAKSAVIYGRKTSACDAILESPVTNEFEPHFCSHKEAI